ncbi:MAG: signal peptide peptidase SppA [bacterium]
MTGSDRGASASPRRGRGAWLALIVLVALGALSVALVAYLGGGDEEHAAFAMGERVGVIEVKGVIVDAKPILDRIESFRKSSSIKAVVVRVDSPGGAVAPSQEIYEAIHRLDEKKPVVASFGSTAASGGFYVACGARHIVANPGTLTGSIGVILEGGNYEKLMEKVGIRSVVVKSGPYKDILSPTREMTKEERDLLQEMVENVYSQFVRAVMTVASRRGLDEAQVRALADGRVLSGEQAFQKGLVDSLGTLRDAVTKAAELAGMSGEPSVYYPEEHRALLDRLLGGTLGGWHSVVAPAGPGLYFLLPSW